MFGWLNRGRQAAQSPGASAPDPPKAWKDLCERLEASEAAIRALRADVPDNLKLSRDVDRLKGRLSVTENKLDDSVDQLSTSIQNVRGLATGGTRRGKQANSEATQLGEAMIQALQRLQAGDATAFDQFVAQLRQGAQQNGAAPPGPQGPQPVGFS